MPLRSTLLLILKVTHIAGGVISLPVGLNLLGSTHLVVRVAFGRMPDSVGYASCSTALFIATVSFSFLPHG